MGELLAWELFMAINAGIAWCLWTLVREAMRHATWHIAARKDRRAMAQRHATLEMPADFQIIPAPRLPGQPEPVVVRLRRVS